MSATNDAPEGESDRCPHCFFGMTDGVCQMCGYDAKKAAGLQSRYEVRRLDGRDAPGEKHEDCRYFVLDLTHDPLARLAARAYATAAGGEGYFALRRDLHNLLDRIELKPGSEPSDRERSLIRAEREWQAAHSDLTDRALAAATGGASYFAGEIVHWMGPLAVPHALPSIGPELRTSQDPAEVTCRVCLTNMPAEYPADRGEKGPVYRAGGVPDDTDHDDRGNPL